MLCFIYHQHRTKLSQAIPFTMTLLLLCIDRSANSFSYSIGGSFSQSIKWSNRQQASWSVGRLVDRSVSQSSGSSVIRSMGQTASQCEKIVVLASKFRFFEFLLLKTCRLKACACTCADSGSAAIEIDSARSLYDMFLSTPAVGESLFTLFASLTCAYHNLMTLIK